MSHAFTQVLIHYIFATKNRERVILDQWRDDLHMYIAGIVAKRDGLLIAAGSVEDHIHLLIRIPPSISVMAMVRDIKANSSAWRHTLGDTQFWWQRGYAGFSVSYSKVEIVKKYILNQRQHHLNLGFLEEVEMLLRMHEIPYTDDLFD